MEKELHRQRQFLQELRNNYRGLHYYMALHLHGNITSEKAKEILRDGEIRGQDLSPKQRRFFGARAGGAPVLHRSGHGPSEKMKAIKKLSKHN